MPQGAFVLIVRDGRVLLLRRSPFGVFGDVWYIPGGVVEPGELPIDAAQRETREETGLELARLIPFREWDHVERYGRAQVIVFLADAPEGDPVLNHEHTAWRWASPREFLDQDLSPRAELSSVFAEWWAGAKEDFRRLAQRIESGH